MSIYHNNFEEKLLYKKHLSTSDNIIIFNSDENKILEDANKVVNSLRNSNELEIEFLVNSVLCTPSHTYQLYMSNITYGTIYYCRKKMKELQRAKWSILL